MSRWCRIVVWPDVIDDMTCWTSSYLIECWGEPRCQLSCATNHEYWPLAQTLLDRRLCHVPLVRTLWSLEQLCCSLDAVAVTLLPKHWTQQMSSSHDCCMFSNGLTPTVNFFLSILRFTENFDIFCHFWQLLRLYNSGHHLHMVQIVFSILSVGRHKL